VFARHGRVFWVEFKATGQKPTELQEDEHRKMRSAGLTVYWTDSRDGFAFILAMEEGSEYAWIGTISNKENLNKILNLNYCQD
jgi:hypothetical protein